jgi:hypothetical protein
MRALSERFVAVVAAVAWRRLSGFVGTIET